jgi:hypothetical protein
MTFGLFIFPEEHGVNPMLDRREREPAVMAADPMVLKNSRLVLFFMISPLCLNKLVFYYNEKRENKKFF